MPVSQRVIAAYLSQRQSVGGGAAATAPANTVAPVVTGTATVGQTLSTTDGTWTGTAPIVYTYQWQRAGVNIGSATAATYLLVDADYNSAIRCVVTATNTAGNASANSNATAAVVRTYSQQVLADSPAGYWKLDETSGNSLADSSGNALTLTRQTVAGTGPVVNQTPLITNGKSVLFASSTNTGYLSKTTDTHLNLGDVFTLEAWINVPAFTGAAVILQKGSGSYQLSINASTGFQLVKTGTAVIVDSTGGLATSTTYHCVATKSGATCKLYLNGADVTGTVTNATCSDTASDLQIGQYFTGIQFFNGKIDEVAVYPTALSAARVAAHYAARTL